MDNTNENIYEEKITKNIMEIFRFKYTKSGKFIVCDLCGRRFMKNYIGIGINERMINHHNQTHAQRWWAEETNYDKNKPIPF